MLEPPRPEYPRPQFVRKEWATLNGNWEFEIDDENIGLEQSWFSAPHFSKQILVPFSLETELSGIGDRAFHPCVWYRKTFRVPQEWSCKRVLIHFGAVDYRAMVWVNGVLCCMHEGGHTPFHGDITGALHAGDNVVTVRAEDPPDDRYIPRGKQYWEAESISIYYARTTGIWQSVWMEPVSDSHFDSLRITPTNIGSVTFEAKITGSKSALHVTATVLHHHQMLVRQGSSTEGPRAVVSARIDQPDLWSPDSPSLYQARVELHGPAGLLDTVDCYFGFREVRTEDGRIILNGSPFYLNAVLDQGYWPESNLTPPSDQAIVEDIRHTKGMGFNAVRKHQKVEDPRYLYWADRLGLLVSAEMANAYLFDEDAVAVMTREWIEVIHRDYNHPSIIIWVPVNESWGVPNLSQMNQQAHLKALYYLTKALDSTRLVIDNDGWEHTDATDLFAIHDYTRTGHEFAERFKTIVPGSIPEPYSGKLYVIPGQEYNGSPIFLSEFGGIGYVLPEDSLRVPRNSWGYAGVESTREDALERMRGLYEAICKMPRIAGVCYTQLYDVEQEVNGLMTYDRRLKFDPEVIRTITSLLNSP